MKVKFTNELKKLKILIQLAELDGYLEENHYIDVESLASRLSCDVNDLLDVLTALDCEINDEIYPDENDRRCHVKRVFIR